jgi:hypothetical protein
MTVSQSTRLGVTLWTEDTDQFTRTQMNDSHGNIELLGARFTAGVSNPTMPDPSYDRAFFYNTGDTFLYFSPDGTEWLKVITDIDAATIDGTETLENKTLTTPVISTISNGGTVTLPNTTDTLVGRATTDTLTNKTVLDSELKETTLNAPIEQWNVVTSAATGTVNIDYLSGAGWIWTPNSTGNIVVNVRGDGSTTLNSLLAVGESVTVVTVFPMGTTPYYVTGMTIDGASQTLKWSAGEAPTEGIASSSETYFFTIIKTAATPTYVTLAQKVQFA